MEARFYGAGGAALALAIGVGLTPAAAAPTLVSLQLHYAAGQHFIYSVNRTYSDHLTVSGAGQNTKATEIITARGRVSFTVTAVNAAGVATAAMHTNIVLSDTYNGRTQKVTLRVPHTVRLWPDGRSTDQGNIPYFLVSAATYSPSFPGVPAHPVAVGTSWTMAEPAYEEVPGLTFDRPVPVGPVLLHTSVRSLGRDGAVPIVLVHSGDSSNFRVRGTFQKLPVAVHDVETDSLDVSLDLQHHRLRRATSSGIDKIFARITRSDGSALQARYQITYHQTISPVDTP